MTQTTINQDEINGILWKACDTFRGTIDPSEYKNYILVMLFVKYISDVWADKVDEFRRQYAGGETHRYLGKQYRLKIVADDKERVKLTRGRLFVYTPDPQQREQVQALLTGWYHGHAQHVFTERLAACFPRVAKYGLAYPELEIRQMEKRWGSCTAEGKVLLNLRLIQAPKKLIDYVVMHELCHLKEHHHGASFYALLGRAMPDWRERRQLLNEMDVA
jgi:predicted metal-dependent hydrolase